MLSAEELHRRGLALSHAGRYGPARTRLRQALERAQTPETVARVKLSLAYVESELGSTAQGLALCSEALTEPALPRLVRGLVQSQLALLHVRAGAGQQALAAFSAAISLLDESDEALARAHLNRGLVYLQRGDAVRAADDAHRAGELYRAAGDPVAAAKADHNFGCARLLAGDIVAALRSMEAAAPLLESLSPTSQAVVSQDRAEVLVAAGRPAEAVAAFETAARAYGSRGLRQRQGEVELLLARTLAQDDPRRAAVVARRAARRFARRGSEAWALRAEAVALTAALDAGNSRPGEVERAEELVASLRSHRLLHDALRVSLAAARARLRSGDVHGAARRLATVRPGPSAPLDVRLRAREVRAEVSAASGRRSSGLRQVRDGLDDLHRWQAAFGSLDLQSTVVGHGRRLASQGLRLALSDGRAEVIFEWSERARALASRVSPVRPAGDPAAVSALAELRQTDDEARAARLRARITREAWYGEGSREVDRPATLDQVATIVGDAGGALASYLVADDELWCVVVGRGGCDVVRLPELPRIRALLAGMQADLDMAAASMPEPVRRVVVEGLRARLATLSTLLVAPIAERLDAERVVVVPPGALAGTPWTLLPGLSGRAVTVPRSATRWVAARTLAWSSARVGMVAGPRVSRADEEVTKASASYPRAEVLQGAAATAEAVSELACKVDILHVAAHGRHSADNPLFSGLELADGPWFGYDIDQLSSIPVTVVLSACELGRSAVRWGDETIGMTVAWQHAGTRCVIAAPASVADDVACEVLSEMHSRLAAGSPPAEALADASRVADRDGLSSFLTFGAGW